MSVRQVKVHGRKVWQVTMRVATVSILILLVIVSVARAECAWVLWTQALNPQTRRVLGDWNPAAGFNTREECVRSEERLRSVSVPNSVTATCLPDTVDPRGPKGK